MSLETPFLAPTGLRGCKLTKLGLMQTDTSERKKAEPGVRKGISLHITLLSLPVTTLTSSLPPTSALIYILCVVIVWGIEEAEAIYLLKVLHAE